MANLGQHTLESLAAALKKRRIATAVGDDLFRPSLGIFVKTTLKAFILIGYFLLSGSANSAEYFYLTHYAPAYAVGDGSTPPVDDPAYADTVIYLDGNRIGLYNSDCNGEIKKILPFSQGRAFVGIVDEAGGDIAFKRFLKTKIHTDIDQWQKKYLTKFPAIESETMGCVLLESSMIFRSTNEIIITDTSYFYRFLLGKKPN